MKDKKVKIVLTKGRVLMEGWKLRKYRWGMWFMYFLYKYEYGAFKSVETTIKRGQR
jgi:hypothetical protein